MRPTALLALAVWSVTGVLAQSLSFIEPAANALTALGDNLQYDIGENVTVSWSTDYEYTTLRVYQGPLDDGSYARETLARNYTQANTTFRWQAAAIGNAKLTHPFHFELINGHDSSCEGCSANSLTFYLSRSSVPSASSSSSTTSATSTSTSSTQSAIASPTSSNSPSAPAATTAAPVASAGNSRKDLAIGLGVGLGVGIPVLLALLGLLAFCLLRRRKRSQPSNLPRGRQPGSLASESQTAMQQRDSTEPPMPQHQAFAPYRPELARSSGGAASRDSSYFEPFDFERPGSRDFDTKSVMSEVAPGGASAAPRLDAIHEGSRPVTPNWPLPRNML